MSAFVAVLLMLAPPQDGLDRSIEGLLRNRGVNRFAFRDGAYFCRTAAIGGPSEFIDGNGEVQRLLFARWIDLR